MWHPVKTEDFDKNLLKGMNTVPIKEMENFEGKLIQTPNGETIIDFDRILPDMWNLLYLVKTVKRLF